MIESTDRILHVIRIFFGSEKKGAGLGLVTVTLAATLTGNLAAAIG